ncbi:hypothetical protein QC761_701360 [Podospora bellae-mahoneyi]|uniref:Stc1 domain-containing protein n=1 Tax=Podospora bellae-mahoneyi TaxID=2093777 RepID=A0ABR0F739_9PEZI|nr:hypothetical protein QC761_701360 [Podospora bellae-mahoneyi]
MADRCILAISGIPAFSQPLGRRPPPIISLGAHEIVLPRRWQCQSCNCQTLCNAYELHLNPLISTPIFVQPVRQQEILSSYLESSSSDYEDIPNIKDWKPTKQKASHKPEKNKVPKLQPSTCWNCKKPMILSCILLNKFSNPICTLSGVNLIPNRLTPAGIQCCACERPHFLSSRPFSVDEQDHPPSQRPTTLHPSSKPLTYQSSAAPGPRDPRPPCAHCLHPSTLYTAQIYQKLTQESCQGNCWIISRYGERLAKIQDLFTPVSLPWLLPDAKPDDEPKQGLLHLHLRLCEDHVGECSSVVGEEKQRKNRAQKRAEASAARATEREYPTRLGPGEGTSRVDRRVAAAERRVVNAEKLSEAEKRRDEVVEKIGEARVWVLGVLTGRRVSYEHAEGGIADDGDGSGEDGGDNRDAEMKDVSEADGGGNDEGVGHGQDREGDVNMDTAGEKQDESPKRSRKRKVINWDDESLPQPDPSHVRYCSYRGIPLYEPRPGRRR